MAEAGEEDCEGEEDGTGKEMNACRLQGRGQMPDIQGKG